MATESGQANASANEEPVSPWVAALNQLREWDPEWAEQCVKMVRNPWADGILPVKFIELVSVGLNASRTNLNPEARVATFELRLLRARAVRRSCSFLSARPQCLFIA